MNRIIPARLLMMRRILALIVLAIAACTAASAQAVEDSSRSTIGYIGSDGTVESKSRSTIGYFRPNGAVENSSRSTIGYIRKDGSVENASRSTIGYIRDNGTVENASRSTIGYVRSGVVENSSRSTIGYAKGIDPKTQPHSSFSFSNPRLSDPPLLARQRTYCRPPDNRAYGYDMLPETGPLSQKCVRMYPTPVRKARRRDCLPHLYLYSRQR